jgi:hypothetical protein
VIRAVPDADWVRRHLGALVGLGNGGVLGGGDRSEMFAAWRHFFEALAEQRPLVLVFEDLHWADDGLLDFVDYLAGWAGEVALLVVGTARPELLARRPGWAGGKPNALTLSLTPLSDEDTARLIGSLIGRPVLDAGQQAVLLAHAGGNPLYAEQYAQMLADQGTGQQAFTAGVGPGHHRRPAGSAGTAGEAPAPGCSGDREGLLARCGRRARRHARPW